MTQQLVTMPGCSDQYMVTVTSSSVCDRKSKVLSNTLILFTLVLFARLTVADQMTSLIDIFSCSSDRPEVTSLTISKALNDSGYVVTAIKQIDACNTTLALSELVDNMVDKMAVVGPGAYWLCDFTWYLWRQQQVSDLLVIFDLNPYRQERYSTVCCL